MTSRHWMHVLCVFAIAFVAVGCGPQSIDEVKSMMKQPERPAALDHLNMWVGTWEGEATMTFPGIEGELKGRGTNTTEWSADKWILTETWEHAMDGIGPMKGTSLMWYDMGKEKFRIVGTDTMGLYGEGWMTYYPDTNCWEMEMYWHDPQRGKSYGKGHVKMVDENKMKWHFAEYDQMGLIKFMEMRGTSKRVR